jgi:hypothetical protein
MLHARRPPTKRGPLTRYQRRIGLRWVRAKSIVTRLWFNPTSEQPRAFRFHGILSEERLHVLDEGARGGWR